MADAPPLPDQPLPDSMSYSLVVNPDGSEEYTAVTLSNSVSHFCQPQHTQAAHPRKEDGLGVDAPAVTVFVTVTPNPVTITITDFITEPPVTVLLPAPSSAPQVIPTVSSEGISVSVGSATPAYTLTSSSSTLTSSSPSTTRTQTTTRSTTSHIPSSTSHTLASQTSPSATLPTNTTSEQAPVSPVPQSALPSITGTARTYLGLAPNAFLGVILAIVLSLIILLCCLLCFLGRRRRQRRKEQEGYPPTGEQGSRLLAGDRDPTREDLVYPYSEPGREYRRSQIAVMRARGELDDDWEDRVHSPSIRTASLRLPEEEIGAAYGIRERAFAAAGVRPPYGYTPVPKEASSIRSGMRSVRSAGNSTVVPAITPTTAGMTAVAVTTPKAADSENRASPTPRKDTQSTQATNDSSAIHMYATGGRSRMDSSEGAEQLFYQQTEEGEPLSAMASSSDLHFLQRYSTQAVAGAAAAAAALASRQRSEGSESAKSSSGSGETGSANRTRNLEDLARAAIAYPESPVSDSQENSQLMPEGEGDPLVMVLNDTPSRS
jgi:hypothetical protein